MYAIRASHIHRIVIFMMSMGLTGASQCYSLGYSVVRRMNEVDQHWARLVLGWMTVFWRLCLPHWYVTKPTRSTQPCISPGSLNRVPALTGWDKGGNVISAWWKVTLCDPIWHVSSRNGEACCELLFPVTLLYLLVLAWWCVDSWNLRTTTRRRWNGHVVHRASTTT